MPPTTTTSRHRGTRRPLTFIAMLAALAAASLGLAACGGSSTTTTTVQRGANAAATGTTTGSAATGTSTTGTSTTGKSTTTGTGTATTPSSTNAPRITAIRSCLAKKGITIPQSHPLADAKLPHGMSRSQFYEQLRGCAGGLLPPHGAAGAKSLAGRKGFHNPFSNPRFHTVLARFAACLRQQGVNVGEPNTSGKGPIFNTKGVNTGIPQFKAATAKCRSTLLYALRSTRAHPGAGTK